MKTKLLFLCCALHIALYLSAEVYQSGDVYYELNDESQTASVVKVSYHDYKGYVQIKSELYVYYKQKHYTVTSISNWAFHNCSGLTSIYIPESVTSIGHDAFNGCSGLTSVTIPKSVTSIGHDAFYDCLGLRNGEVSITDIAAWCGIAFSNYAANPLYYAHYLYLYGIRVTDLEIPSSVTSIGDYAFEGCSGLWSVSIPSSVTSIGKYAFYGCSGLPIENGIRYADTYLVEAVDKSQSTYTIKEGTKWIGSDAFAECSNLTTITIPKSVTSIGYKAFHNCSTITSITIPESIKKIGQSICAGCSGLKSIIWNAPSITGEMYYEDNTSYSPFYGAESVLSFVFGPKVEIIPAYICYNMPISDIIIPQSVKTIEYGAFRDCSELTSVTIPNSVTSIGNYAFSGCKNRAFTKLNIPHSVKSMGDYAFANCEYLTSISFGDGLEEIGDYAFSGCIRVNDMTSFATVTPSAEEHTFDKVNHLAYLFVQAGSKRTYQLDPIWGVFDIHEIGAESSTTVDNSVQVIPLDNEASFTWPLTEDAATYTLVITKDGVVFCTLIFNANGQLQGIAFAPARDGSAHAPAATTSMAGMNFTVTGLDGASKYAYRLAAKDNSGSELIAYAGEFATTGYEGEVNPGGKPEKEEEGLFDINSEIPSTKLLRDGQLLIQRNDKTYNMQGAVVK